MFGKQFLQSSSRVLQVAQRARVLKPCGVSAMRSFATVPHGTAAVQSATFMSSPFVPKENVFEDVPAPATTVTPIADNNMFRQVVIRDSRALVHAILKYIPDNEVDTYRTMLQTIREHPNIRPLALKKLSGQMALQTFSEQVQSAQEQTTLGHSPSSSTSNSTSATGAKRSQHQKLKTQWLDQWLLKALDNKRVNLFPIRLPPALDQTRVLPLNKSIQEINDAPAPECVQRLLQQKAKLAAYLFSHKQLLHSSFREFLLTTEPFDPFPEETPERVSRSPSHRVSSYASTSTMFRPVPNKEEEMIYIAASRIADELGDALHVDRLQDINRIVKLLVEGDIDNDKFLLELSSVTSLHIDLCYPLLEFLDVDLSTALHELIQSRRVRRQQLLDSLQAELSYLVYLHSVSNSAAHHAMLHNTPNRKSLDDFVRDSPLFDTVGVEGKDVHTTRALDEARREFEMSKLARKPTIIFGLTHQFEIALRAFPKTAALPTQLSVNMNSNLHFQSSLKTTTKEKPTGDFTPEDLDQLVRCVRNDDVDDLELSQKDEHDGKHERPQTEEEILIDSHASPVRKIFIDNLPHGITEQDISAALRKCGKVKRVFLFTSDMQENKLDAQDVSTPVDQIADSPNVSLLDSLAVKAPKKSNKNKDHEDEAISVTISDEEEEEEENAISLEEPQVCVATDVDKKKKKNLRNFKRHLNKTIVLKSSRTDNYAFVVMEDDESFARVCSDPIRIFGININGQSCKTYKVHDYHNFRLELSEYIPIQDVQQAINIALEGKFETYLTSRVSESTKPLFVNLTFNDHADTWKAFHMLHRACTHDGLSFMKPTWVRTQRYHKLGNRAKTAVEKDINERELMGVMDRMRLTESVAQQQKQNKERSQQQRQMQDDDSEDDIDVMDALNSLSKQHQHSFE